MPDFGKPYPYRRSCAKDCIPPSPGVKAVHGKKCEIVIYASKWSRRAEAKRDIVVYGATLAKCKANARGYQEPKATLDTHTTLGEYIEQDFLVSEERRTRITTKPLSWGTFTARRGRLLNWLINPNVRKYPFLKANAVYTLVRTPLGKLTPKHLEAYFDVLLDGNTSWEIRFQLRTDFGMIFNRAEDLIAFAPTRLLKDAKLEDKPDVDKDTWTAAEVFAVTSDKTKPILLRCFVAFQFAMACRPSEIFALDFQDFSDDFRMVVMDKASRRTEQGEEVKPGLKRKPGMMRAVPAELAAMLQELRKAYRAQGHGWNDKEPVFAIEGVRFTKDRFTARWDRYRKALGLRPGPSFYSLKTSGNDFLAERGLSDEVRAARAGHSNTKLVKTTYRSKASRDRMGDVAAAEFDGIARGA